MTRRRTGPIGLLPLLLALVLGAAAAAPIAPAAAQQPGDASVNAPEGQVAASDIVVIDFQGVVRESTAAQAVQD